LGRNYLITFQERYFGFFDAVRERIRAGVGPIWSMGADYLAYALLDTLIDHYYPVAENISQKLEDLEDEIVDDPHPDVLVDIHTLRRQLVVLRRVGWPQREALSTLLRSNTSPFITDQVRTYLRDTADHIAQIVELVDASHEAAIGLSEIYLSQVSFKTNEIMKMLTLMASIFIPLTFIAGIYGMNFENMPELHSAFGYFAVIGVMLIVAIGMLVYFRRRGWLGTPRRRPKTPLATD
jgi:magnesium transporter